MKDCIVLKKKEYEELRAKANAKEPDYLRLTLMYTRNKWGSYVEETTNLNFSGVLSQQIRRISYKILTKLRKEENETISNFINKELKNKTKRELYKFIQNYNG